FTSLKQLLFFSRSTKPQKTLQIRTGQSATNNQDMGRSSSRRKEFLRKHPLCCFCGGVAPSEEPDHVPSRVLFDNREWPEGYEFPACVLCNRASRHHEQVIAMLSRIFPDAQSPEEKREVHARIQAVANNFPEILIEMRPTPEQNTRAVTKYGLE